MASIDAPIPKNCSSRALCTGPVTASTTHGFTGHEEVDSLNFIHMNGRTYDPTLGRMLQADPMADGSSQGWNRFSYVNNNPLTLTDPSGNYALGNLLGLQYAPMIQRNPYARLAGAIVAAYFTFGLAYGWVAVYAGEGIEAGAVAGAAAGFVSGTIQSSGNLQGALEGAFSGALFGGIGGYFGNEYSFGRVLTEATAGGIVSTVEGGKFGNGFVSAGVAATAAPWVARIDDAGGRVLASSIIGGTASQISGGKFSNGAMTGAFQDIVAEAAERHALIGRMEAAASFHADSAIAATDINLFARGTLQFDDANLYTDPPDSFSVAGHSNSTYMSDMRTDQNSPTAYYADEMAELIKSSGWTPGESVYLLGCYTGGTTGSSGIDNIAQSVANILQTDVYGADKYYFSDGGQSQVFGRVTDPTSPTGYRANPNDPGSMIRFSPLARW